MKRPFRGLRRPPDPRYDAVVIGSGIGGLIAANLLARGGMKVLLVEQHYMAGGFCSTFRRGGYTFDAATHFYPLLGNPGTLPGRILAELGVTTGWVKMDPVDVFHFPDGTRFAVAADFETYFDALKAEFPHENAALEGFFGTVRKAYFAGLLHYFRGLPAARVEKLQPLREVTVMNALDQWFRDPKLKLLLTADAPHWGSPPDRTSFVFDSMLRLSYFLGNYYPRGGSQAFADELALRLEEQGGHVLMSTAARRIVIEGGTARGVELETLRGPWRGPAAVRSDIVVSNADLLLTYEELVGEEHLPEGHLAALRGMRCTFPCWLTHLGLRDVPDAVLNAAQGYYWDDWDPRGMGRNALRFKLFSPTLYEPAMAPEGGKVLIVQKVLDLDYDGITDWPAHKRRLEEYVFGNLEKVLPGIGEHIVVRTSATAQTSWRFTWNHQGAMLGWEMSPDQLGPERPGTESPVRNLHLVGHWVQPGGGITPVMVSAQQLARRILEGRDAALDEPFGTALEPSLVPSRAGPAGWARAG